MTAAWQQLCRLVREFRARQREPLTPHDLDDQGWITEADKRAWHRMVASERRRHRERHSLTTTRKERSE